MAQKKSIPSVKYVMMGSLAGCLHIDMHTGSKVVLQN